MRTVFISIVSSFLGAFLFHYFQFGIGSEAKAGGQKVITATQIDLVDSQGRLRAQLGFSKEGPPGLWIMDERGVARIAMGLYPDGTSHIGLQDKNGLMIQLLRSIGPSESPLLILKNKGQDRMIMGLNSSQVEPFLISYDKNQKKKIYSGFADGP